MQKYRATWIGGLFFLYCAWANASGSAAQATPLTLTKQLFDHVHHRLSQIGTEGKVELYMTGYAWHNRYFYTPERIQQAHYNEFAAGGGLGKGFIDEDGDWHALYAMGFSDSHRNAQPLAGYGFIKRLYLPAKAYIGGGYTWFVTSRQDIMHGIPFPGFPLPMIAVGGSHLSFFATYVPGGHNIVNVLFVFAKWNF